MTWNMRPLSVTILAWLYIGVGMIGFVSHFTEIHARNAFRYDGIWIEVVEVLAIVCGAFMLRGHNWARWLAIAWMVFHVVLSAFGAFHEFAIHSLFCGPNHSEFAGDYVLPLVLCIGPLSLYRTAVGRKRSQAIAEPRSRSPCWPLSEIPKSVHHLLTM